MRNFCSEKVPNNFSAKNTSITDFVSIIRCNTSQLTTSLNFQCFEQLGSDFFFFQNYHENSLRSRSATLCHHTNGGGTEPNNQSQLLATLSEERGAWVEGEPESNSHNQLLDIPVEMPGRHYLVVYEVYVLPFILSE